MRLMLFFLASYLFVAISFAAEFVVTPGQLITEINLRKTKVLEFKQLHNYGKTHNLRIWIAGGSAAGLAHYVKDDLENEFLKEEGKDPIYFEERFAYYYYDIYRSTQDCDVIIDGDESQALELEEFIRNNFAHLQGSKEVFEVRLLDKPRGFGAGQKDALINNPNFLNQHTDSHSTGMIELTQPPETESAVRDLFDWNNQRNSQFLLDVIDNQLSYYFNSKHNQTKRFQDGINPPILSVLRYYTKLFQYGLKPRPGDEKFLLQIINEFDPLDPAWNENYVNKQINKNGIKMIRHAQDMEFAINTITRVGLKDKLLNFKGKQEEQISWWVNREPLRSFPLGRKPGKTAKELGITVVAHETRDFLAYESITMSRRGVPNVFISREGFDKELAVFGNGFYTKKGEEGAIGSGLTIRYTVNPNAVEGVDFIYIPKEKYVIFLNRNALKVIDESIVLEPLEFFKILGDQGIKDSDRGVLQKIELKVKSQINIITDSEAKEIASFVQKTVTSPHRNSKWIVLEKWLSLEISKNYPNIIEDFFKEDKFDYPVLKYVAMNPYWMEKYSKEIENIIKRIIKSKKIGRMEIMAKVLGQEYWAQHPNGYKYVNALLRKYGPEDDARLIISVLSQFHWWNGNPRGVDLIEKVVPTPKSSYNERTSFGYIQAIFFTYLDTADEKYEAAVVNLIERLILKNNQNIDKALSLPLSQEHWLQNPRLKKLCNGKEVTAENIRQGLIEEFNQQKRDCSEGLEVH